MANALDFLTNVGNLSNPIALGATGVGLIGSLFGSGSEVEIPPELREVYQMLLTRSQEGLSNEAVDAMIRRAKTSLGEEAGALGALTESRLTRAGAGEGVKNTALQRINKERLGAIGEASISADLADEEAKQRALSQLSQLAPLFGSKEFKSTHGEGFANLLQGGLSYLLNKPGDQNAGGGDARYTTPYTPENYTNPNADIFSNRQRRNFLDIYDTPYSGNPNYYTG